MRRFKFEKLVRDKIVDQIISTGDKPNWKVLSDSEYIQKLKDKIVEESQEIPRTTDQEEIVKELAPIALSRFSIAFDKSTTVTSTSCLSRHFFGLRFFSININATVS